jgi:hypothetical protein
LKRTKRPNKLKHLSLAILSIIRLIDNLLSKAKRISKDKPSSLPRYSTTLYKKAFNGVDHRRLERPPSTSLQAKDKKTIDFLRMRIVCLHTWRLYCKSFMIVIYDHKGMASTIKLKYNCKVFSSVTNYDCKHDATIWSINMT